MAGSVPTPYIWDDKIDVYELASKMLEVYETPKETLSQNGLKGREAFLGDMGLSHTNMCNQMIEGIETVFENWEPRQRYEIFKVS